MQEKIKTAMGLPEWGMVFTLASIFGGSFLFIRVARHDLPPLTLIAMRVAIAALVLNAVVKIAKVKLPSERAIWAQLAVLSILNNVIPFWLIAWAQGYIEAGLAAILNATTPFFTILIAHWATHDEKISVQKIAGVLVGFLGVVVMIGVEQLSSFGINAMAQMAVVAASAGYACSAIYGRRFKGMGLSPLTTATGQVTMGATMLVPLACLIDRPWTLAMPSSQAIGSVVTLGVLCTACAYILFFKILMRAGARNANLTTFLVPVMAIFLGSVFLNERLQAKHFMGMAVLAVGLVLIDGRLLQWARKKLFGELSPR